MKNSVESTNAEDPREAAMRDAVSQNGKSLWELSYESPLLVIFLRHFG